MTQPAFLLEDGIYDLSAHVPTMRSLLETEEPLVWLRSTTPSPKWYWTSTAVVSSRAWPWAITSTCAVWKAAALCCLGKAKDNNASSAIGPLFAPTQHRDQAGGGSTHHGGDTVCIQSPRLGALCNRVAPCDQAAPWQFGLLALFNGVAARGLLARGDL